MNYGNRANRIVYATSLILTAGCSATSSSHTKEPVYEKPPTGRILVDEEKQREKEKNNSDPITAFQGHYKSGNFKGMLGVLGQVPRGLKTKFLEKMAGLAENNPSILADFTANELGKIGESAENYGDSVFDSDPKNAEKVYWLALGSFAESYLKTRGSTNRWGNNPLYLNAAITVAAKLEKLTKKDCREFVLSYLEERGKCEEAAEIADSFGMSSRALQNYVFGVKEYPKETVLRLALEVIKEADGKDFVDILAQEVAGDLTGDRRFYQPTAEESLRRWKREGNEEHLLRAAKNFRMAGEPEELRPEIDKNMRRHIGFVIEEGLFSTAEILAEFVSNPPYGEAVKKTVRKHRRRIEDKERD